jgi:hypothetical protein
VDILFQIEIDARHLYHVCVNLHWTLLFDVDF